MLVQLCACGWQQPMTDTCVWRKVYKKQQPNSVHAPELARFDPTLSRTTLVTCPACQARDMYVQEEPDGRYMYTCHQCNHIVRTFD